MSRYITCYVVLSHMLCYVCYITLDVCVMLFYNMSCYFMLPVMLCYITYYFYFI